MSFFSLKRFLVNSKSRFNFCILLSLSKVIGSTSEDNCLTLLKATYAMPNVCSDFPICTHAFGKVNPWLLWIVRAHASLSDSCCLSCAELPFCAETVTGAIATKEGIFFRNRGANIIIKLNNNSNRQIWRFIWGRINDVHYCSS